MLRAMPAGPRPPRAVVRRRRGVVLALAFAALIAGAVVGAGGGSSGGSGSATGHRAAASTSALQRAHAEVARMSLEQQVGQLLIVAFPGTRAPAYVLRALRERRVAGVILFGGNVSSAASVRALTAQLRRAARAGGGPPPIICLDQEGGAIRTLRFAPSAVGQAGQETPGAAAAAAGATARALKEVGVNVALGPVADVAGGRPESVMTSRAYPGGATAVAASTRAAVQAYLRAGVLPVVKHFPGLGGATANTDDAPATVDRTRPELAADLQPFRAALDAGAPMVMLSHARYPALDSGRIASQSHAIATELLRRELGFDGVTMTDSLEADAALAPTGGDVGAAAVRSLMAGADLLLTTGPGSFPLVREAVMAAARRSSVVRVRMAEASARVLTLRQGL
jgi:beta-N-acetylhexosaminidase